jgi:hypothetical protein
MVPFEGGLRHASVEIAAGTKDDFVLEPESGHHLAALAVAEGLLDRQRPEDGLRDPGTVAEFGVRQQGAETLDEGTGKIRVVQNGHGAAAGTGDDDAILIGAYEAI